MSIFKGALIISQFNPIETAVKTIYFALSFTEFIVTLLKSLFNNKDYYENSIKSIIHFILRIL